MAGGTKLLIGAEMNMLCNVKVASCMNIWCVASQDMTKEVVQRACVSLFCRGGGSAAGGCRAGIGVPGGAEAAQTAGSRSPRGNTGDPFSCLHMYYFQKTVHACCRGVIFVPLVSYTSVQLHF